MKHFWWDYNRLSHHVQYKLEENFIIPIWPPWSICLIPSFLCRLDVKLQEIMFSVAHTKTDHNNIIWFYLKKLVGSPATHHSMHCSVNYCLSFLLSTRRWNYMSFPLKFWIATLKFSFCKWRSSWDFNITIRLFLLGINVVITLQNLREKDI